jgi:hypothetical protein
MPIGAIYGRNAATIPKCAPRTAVHYAWRDILLPIMQDPTFPADTLFFVAEEDWRLREQDEYRVRETTRDVGGHVYVPATKTMHEPSAVQEKIRGPSPRSLCDLVALCNQAARCKYGDLVWLSYMRDSARRPNAGPVFASTLLAVTPQAARVISQWMVRGQGSGAAL